ncbi:MAG: heparinase II/III family protein [Phenylobacterium sp.]
MGRGAVAANGSAGLALTALARAVSQQSQREWAGTPLHEWRIAGPKPTGLAVQPRDLRAPDPENGRRILGGRWQLAGAILDLGPGGDPWDRASPSRRFAVLLHRFGWMADLLALGAAGEAEALRLTLAWRRLFGRWNAFAWSGEALERRVFALACAIRPISGCANAAQASILAAELARQARHLLDLHDGPGRTAERAAAAALAGAALSGPAGQSLLDKALARLTRALPDTVQPDGGHASRTPQAALELLLDLRCLDAALHERGMAAPDEMARAMDRLAGAVRFFTLADGALPALQGGEALTAEQVTAAGASDEARRPIPPSRNGYHRLEGRSLQVIADAAPPATGPWSVSACAQPMAVEVLANGQRLIVGGGWSPEAAAPEAARGLEGASTAALGDADCGLPLQGLAARLLGPRLVAGVAAVEVARHDDETAVLLEMGHAGFEARYGLTHQRRLYLDLADDALRGEDSFVPTAGADGAGGPVPFQIRFHIDPQVRVSMARDGACVLLRPPGDEFGWRLRYDAAEVAIEPAVHYQDGLPRRSEQVVLRGQVPAAGARIRWKLTR